MPKGPPSKRKKTQHDTFVELARESGADESEAAFIAKVRAISSTKPRITSAERARRKGSA
jgi:hypothetical protein